MGGSCWGLEGVSTFSTTAVFVTGFGGGDGGPLSDGLLYGNGPGGLTTGIDWRMGTAAFF